MATNRVNYLLSGYPHQQQYEMVALSCKPVAMLCCHSIPQWSTHSEQPGPSHFSDQFSATRRETYKKLHGFHNALTVWTVYLVRVKTTKLILYAEHVYLWNQWICNKITLLSLMYRYYVFMYVNSDLCPMGIWYSVDVSVVHINCIK